MHHYAHRFLEHLRRVETAQAARAVQDHGWALLRDVQTSDDGTVLHALALARPPPGRELLSVLERDHQGRLHEIVNRKDRRGRTALAAACFTAASPALVELLLRLGAEPNVLDADGNPPLTLLGVDTLGSEHDRIDILKALVNKGARLDLPGDKVRRGRGLLGRARLGLQCGRPLLSPPYHLHTVASHRATSSSTGPALGAVSAASCWRRPSNWRARGGSRAA